MILFDTETTGLPLPEASPLKDQPRIIEFAAIKLADKKPFKQIGAIEFLCYPGIPLPEKITEITGLKDEDLKGQAPFKMHFRQLADFFLGERFLIAHNIAFDLSLLRYDLMRIGKLTAFPWPYAQICTVQASMGYKGHRLRLFQLHEMATGKTHDGAHRAMADVEALMTCVKWLIKEGKISLEG